MATNNTTEVKAVECEPLAEIRTPAAIEAAKKGKKNYVITIPRRYPDDKMRYLKVDSNPEVFVPTEEEVEVAENEFHSLKSSIALRRSNDKFVSKLVNDTHEKGAAL